MLEALRNAFKIPELRKKILFTIAMVAIYRFGAHIPTPGIDRGALKELFGQGGILGFLDLFSGGALSQLAVFALGIMPYITASIIMQLLTVVIPTLEKWSKEGEEGQKKITQWTRYLTLLLAFIQSVGFTQLFQSQLQLRFTILDRSLIIITLVAGTALIMWLGELITQRGIGNGMSLLIFISIISRFPIAVYQTIQVVNPVLIILVVVIIIFVFGSIVLMKKAQRRINIQYAKRVIGRKMYGGSSTFIPLKVNSAGVIPIIFASSLLLFPGTLAQFFPGRIFETISAYLSPGSYFYLSLYALLIIFFAYFYTAIIFNPIDMADNMKKYGGFIPGVRPGKPTAQYIDKVLSRITLPGSVFLAFIAILPSILFSTLNVPFFREFGGISLLILVGVALETMSQLESQLMMRHYEGFLR